MGTGTNAHEIAVELSLDSRPLDPARARRRIVIVAPHFPPSNLASVHRTRLLATHLPEFGWEPIVISVDARFYEERLDWSLTKLVPSDLRVERVSALPTRPIRLVGDIAVRAFLPLLRRITKIVRRERVDFLYLPVPPFFGAPLGRIVHGLTGVPYGIDYIDPWIHRWPGSERILTKHWLSHKLSLFLEPFAVRHASLITGVAEGYYAGVLHRHPALREAVTAAMPYGGEFRDHEAVRALGIKPYLFTPGKGFDFVYAGAMLPKAYGPLEQVFRAICEHRTEFADVRFHFIGSGKSPNDPTAYSIRPLAENYGLWGEIVYEYPARIPYLDVLSHLEAANGIFVLGSTEAHYTPSKIYQAVLSRKPILAVLHEASTACRVLGETGAGRVLSFSGESDIDRVADQFTTVFAEYRRFAASFDPSDVDLTSFEQYSARNTTQVLASALDTVIARRSQAGRLNKV